MSSNLLPHRKLTVQRGPMHVEYVEAKTSSRCCGVEVRRGGATSGIHFSSRAAEQCDVNIHSLTRHSKPGHSLIRQTQILKCQTAASPLVRLVEGEERWDAPDHPQSVLPQNWGETELNRSVTCMVLKAMVNNRRHLALAKMNFVVLDLTFADQVPSQHDSKLIELSITVIWLDSVQAQMAGGVAVGTSVNFALSVNGHGGP
ncbi:cullin-4A [Trichonephila clavipes]|nr:cullin-4A [Trichonephila clavipes]